MDSYCVPGREYGPKFFSTTLLFPSTSVGVVGVDGGGRPS